MPNTSVPAGTQPPAVRPCLYAHVDVCTCATSAGGRVRDFSRCPRMPPESLRSPTHPIAQADGDPVHCSNLGCPNGCWCDVPAHLRSEDGETLTCGHSLEFYETIPGTAGSFCRACVPALLAEDLSDLASHPRTVTLPAPARIIVDTRRAVYDSILDQWADGPAHVTLDCASTTLVDSSGWGVLVRAARETDAAGGSLRLANLCPDLQDILRITKLDAVLLREEPA